MEVIQDTLEQTIGVIGVRKEITPIVESMAVEEVRRIGPTRFHRGTMGGRPAVAGEIGIGKVNAAAAVQALVDHYAPSHLFFTGSAGSLSPDLNVGDLVIADAVAAHDLGTCRSSGFTPTGHMILDEQGREYYVRRLCAPADLVGLAHRAAAGLSWPPSADGETPRVRVGAIVTGDQVILSAEKKDWLTQAFGALAVEMEGAAFAQVADANNVPWLVIRSVSDHADQQLEFAYELWLDYADDAQSPQAQLGRLRDRLAYAASDPKAVLRARQMLSNLRQAAANAARLTEAVIQEL